VALMEFGDFAIGAQLRPGLTTVRPPRFRIGREAVQMPPSTLEGRAVATHRALAWELLVRGTTSSR